MSTFFTIVFFVAGLILIIKGGDMFVDAASWFAEVSGIPKLIVGATVVSIATTLPEMLVSIMAAAEGSVDMATGNAVGSVTANLGLIMAISIICLPSIIKRKDYAAKSIIMLAASAIVMIGGFFGNISIPVSTLLLVLCAAFFYENVRSAKAALSAEAILPKDENTAAANNKSRKKVIINIVKFVFGSVGIVVGARLLVDRGSDIARLIGVSERIIGVTMVAIGTSLPELVTTVTAIVKKQSSLSVGNIIGANILDLTLIMPLASIVTGKNLPVAASAARLDLPACFAVGLIALVPALAKGKFIRVQGFVLLAVYVGYVVFTCLA